METYEKTSVEELKKILQTLDVQAVEILQGN